MNFSTTWSFIEMHLYVSVDTEKHQKKDAFMVLVHLHEHVIVMLQEGMRTADVASGQSNSQTAISVYRTPKTVQQGDRKDSW